MLKSIPTKTSNFLTVKELADILHVSRVTIFNRIKKGDLRAHLAGKTYLIPKDELAGILPGELDQQTKKEIDHGVAKVVADYGETLKLLGKE